MAKTASNNGRKIQSKQKTTLRKRRLLRGEKRLKNVQTQADQLKNVVLFFFIAVH
ncbi:MAG: hypothetical protein ACLRMX_11605 [Lachnospira eligens]